MRVKRPVIPISIVYVLSIILSWVLRDSYRLILAVGSVLIVFSVLLIIFLRRKIFIVLLLAIGIGLFNSSVRIALTEGTRGLYGSELTLCTVEERINLKDDYSEYAVKSLDEDIAQKYKGKILLRVDSQSKYSAGDVLYISQGAPVYEVDSDNNPFSTSARLERKGLFYIASVSAGDISLIHSHPITLSHYISRYREALADNMYSVFNEDTAAILNATVIGDTMLMDDTLRESFSRTGTAHIFVISGLHVGFFLKITQWITVFIKKRPGMRNFIRILLTVIYVIFTGASISAIRALIFAILYLGCRRRGLRADPVMILSASALIILTVSPFDLFSQGFILSFSAVLGIVLLKAPIAGCLMKAYKGESRRVINAIGTIAVSIGAQAGIIIPMAIFYNTLSPSAFITNIVVIPVASLVYTLGFVLNLIGVVLSYIPQPGVYAVEGLVYVMTKFVGLISSIPFAQLTVATPSVFLCMAICGAIYFISPERPRCLLRGGKYVALSLLPVVIIFALLPHFTVNDNFTAYLSDRGDGTTLTAISPRGMVVVVYNGCDIDEDVVSTLKRHNGGVIDVLITLSTNNNAYNIWARDINNTYIEHHTDEIYNKALEAGAYIAYIDSYEFYKSRKNEYVHIDKEDNNIRIRITGGESVLNISVKDNALSVID